MQQARCCDSKTANLPSLVRPAISRVLSVVRIMALEIGLAPLITLVVMAISSPPVSGVTKEISHQVFVIPVHNVIDLGLAFFIKRSLDTAEKAGAAYVILDVNTLGGRVDAALEIRDALEECPLPTAAFVDKRAISAGALVCLATKYVAMAPGSTIGAATPISIAPGGGKVELGEKEVSYVRGEFRATAERNGHSPVLAEAMVDPDVEAVAVFENGIPRIMSQSEAEAFKKGKTGISIETVSSKGKLLTMTSGESMRMGLAKSTPETLDEMITLLDLDPAYKFVAKVSWSENIVRFLTNPIVSGLLLTFGVLGIFFELQMPGWGISGTVGAVCLLLFFSGHYLAGLANVMDIVLFVIGLGLLALELLVIPGFGVTGIAGLICIMAGIYLALVERPIPRFSWDYQIVNGALLTFIIMVCAVTAGIALIVRLSPESRLKRILILSAREDAKDGFTASTGLEALIGQTGKSMTHLRPAGRALFGGEPVEVQTQGEFIEINRPVRVVRVVGNKIFVVEDEKGKA